MTLIFGSAGLRAVAVACLISGGAIAQEPPIDGLPAPGVPETGATAPTIGGSNAVGSNTLGSNAVTPPAETPVAGPSTAGSGGWAKVVAGEAALRCFQTAHSPTWPETLRTGDVVKVSGPAESGFVPVELPLGVLGFVHSRFVAVGADGAVTSKAERVSFRCAAESGTAPIEILDQTAKLQLVSQQGEWLCVRRAGRVAWVAEADVSLFAEGSDTPTLAAGWADLGQRQQTQVAAAATAIAATKAAEVRATELATQASGLRGRVVAESAKPESGQQSSAERWSALTEEAAALVTAIGEGPGKADAEWSFRTADGNRRRVELAAFATSTDHPDPNIPQLSRPTETDPMKGCVIGWLRYHKPLFGESRLELEKGGQVLFELTCTSGRYNLAEFDGFEVALRGDAERGMVDRGQPKEYRTLDVSRMEILGHPTAR